MDNNKKTIALTGWATWGHIFPLLSVYNYFRDENKYNFVWVGEEDSMEQEIAEKNLIPFYEVPAGKLRRYFDIRNFFEPLKNLTGVVFAMYYIWKYKIDIVFSKWGYVSLPLCIAAFFMRKPIYVHESDAVWWVANKIISKLATKVFYTFENKLTQSENEKHIASGPIMNSDLIDKLTNLHTEENEKLEVLVICGSQWATTIFESLLKILPDLKDINFNIVLWSKNADMKSEFLRYLNVKTHEFVDQKDLGLMMKKADIAITRWSSTLWELNYFGIHSIIIPLPHSAWNHQQKNAEFFHEKFWSNIIEENGTMNLEIFRLLQWYKQMRKTQLNLNNFFSALHIFEENFDK